MLLRWCLAEEPALSVSKAAIALPSMEPLAALSRSTMAVES